MAEQIKFADPKDGKEYVLEYDRDSVRFAEDIGINIVELMRGKVKAATLWTGLFYSALHKHQPLLTQDEADDIWSRVTNKAEVADALQEMIQEPFASMLGDEAEGDPKNAVTIQLPSKKKAVKAAK